VAVETVGEITAKGKSKGINTVQHFRGEVFSVVLREKAKDKIR
jgi:hypothetical protein